MPKVITFLYIGIVVALVLFVWHKWPREGESLSVMPQGEHVKKISVVATFYPLAEFAEKVGGEKVAVKTIVPTGAEPHDYEPSPQDILAIYESDIFLLNGAGLDAWAEKIRPELEQRGVRVLQLSERVSLLPGVAEEEEHEEGEEEAHTESVYDPHFWLDPVLAQEEVKALSQTLIETDPSNAQVYSEKRESFLRTLVELDNEYKKSLAQCQQDTIVTSHNAFSYLSQRYGFKVLSLSGLSPEAEPSSRRLAEMATLIREKDIRYIFFETLVSPKVAETLAKETGIETLVFNPLEGLTAVEKERGENYTSIMKSNLVNLKQALTCQN